LHFQERILLAESDFLRMSVLFQEVQNKWLTLLLAPRRVAGNFIIFKCLQCEFLRTYLHLASGEVEKWKSDRVNVRNST